MLSAYLVNSLLIIVGFLIILGIVGLLAYFMVKRSHRIASSTFDRHIADAMRPKIEHPERASGNHRWQHLCVTCSDMFRHGSTSAANDGSPKPFLNFIREPPMATLNVPSSITTIPVRHQHGHRSTGQNRLNRTPIPSPIAIPQPPPKIRIWQKPIMDNHVHVPPPPTITLTNASMTTREL